MITPISIYDDDAPSVSSDDTKSQANGSLVPKALNSTQVELVDDSIEYICIKLSSFNGFVSMYRHQ